MAARMTNRDIFLDVQQTILGALAQGVIPWRRPWKAWGADRNMVSKRPYRGINKILLGLAGYDCPLWLTARQVELKKGTITDWKPHRVIFCRTFLTKQVDPKTGKRVRAFFYRVYQLFNLRQTTVPEPKIVPAVPVVPMVEAHRILTEMPNRPYMDHGNPTGYDPDTDWMYIPTDNAGLSTEEYYDDVFHNLIHATGHDTRLRRASVEDCRQANHTYSKEDLVAEIGKAFLFEAAQMHLPPLKDQAGYIRGFTDLLKTEPRLMLAMANAAQRAVDHVLNVHMQYEDPKEEEETEPSLRA